MLLPRIQRYLIREVLLTFLATALVLVAMVLSHRFATYLSQAATGLLARDAIFTLLALQALRFLVILIPVSALIAVMLAFGRLYRDSEMVAMGALGLGPANWYGALLKFGIPMALLLAVLTMVVLPRTMNLQYEILDRAREDAELSVFSPGTFREVDQGRHTVYVGKVSDNGRALGDIFVRSYLDPGLAVTTATRGRQEMDLEEGIRFLVLEDGNRYEGFGTASGDYRVIAFESARFRLDPVPGTRNADRRDTLSTLDLLGSSEPERVAELHARLSGPISLLVLLSLAPLLARGNPREGRYGRVILAILIYVVYFNLLGIGEAHLKAGTLPGWMGLWWAHGIMLVVALALGWRLWLPPRRTKLEAA